MAGAVEFARSNFTITTPEGEQLGPGTVIIRDRHLTVYTGRQREKVLEAGTLGPVRHPSRREWAVDTEAGTYTFAKAGGCGCGG